MDNKKKLTLSSEETKTIIFVGKPSLNKKRLKLIELPLGFNY